jgi:hypothetical protein
MNLFALVDCNNFYVSCERVFNPRLEGHPVIVLSNNDGCVVARSQEARQLGIGMGEPFFKIKELCSKRGVIVYSSNYELYGDHAMCEFRFSLYGLCFSRAFYHVASRRKRRKFAHRVNTVDAINARFGRHSLFYGAMGIDQGWASRSDNHSRRYTTRWDELAIVKA